MCQSVHNSEQKRDYGSGFVKEDGVIEGEIMTKPCFLQSRDQVLQSAEQQQGEKKVQYLTCQTRINLDYYK